MPESISSPERALRVIVLCHFLASFAVLGMSAYYPLLLERCYPETSPSWGGLFYAIPLLVMSLTSPLWGWFGDRFGKRLSLMRAQIGLALALLACSLAPTPAWFAICLIFQGMFGGTFAASNALMSNYCQGQTLARGLSYLQYSARLGLFLAPTLVGPFVVQMPEPRTIYLWLWLLPLASLMLLQLALPRYPGGLHKDLPGTPHAQSVPIPFHHLLLAEFWFTLITVLTFPYFADYFFARSSGLGAEWSGLYFGLPHLVYLVLAFWVIGRASLARAPGQVSLAFALYLAAMALHLTSNGPLCLGLARVLMGLALLFGYVSLNVLLGASIRPRSAGRAFGWLDSASKFAGVIAGVLAGVSVRWGGVNAPFALAAVLGIPLWWLSLKYRKASPR